MTHRPEAAGKGAGPGTILVIEDDRPTRQLLGAILDEEGLPYHLAATGHEAMEYAAANPPEMVVLDMYLPNLQGEAVATALHIQYGRSLPILAMSASNEAAAAARAGAFDFLSKPFDIEELLTKIHKGLALAEAARTLRTRSQTARQRVQQAAGRQREAFERRRAEKRRGRATPPSTEAVQA